MKHPYQLRSSEGRDDLRIIPFQENGIKYEFCFIILNPFYKRKNNFEDFETQKPKWIEGLKSDINKDYIRYSWSDFLDHSGIKDIKQIFHCLYASDYNYVERFQKVKKQVWESFQNTLTENQLIANSDGHLSVLLIDDVLKALKKLGYDKLALYDIFTKKIKYTKTSDLIELEKEFPSEFRLLTDDGKILIYQEYEHYDTFVYSTDLKVLKLFVELADLEGFFAHNRTTLLWNEVEFNKDEEVIRISTE